MKIFITGATGFIGSALTKNLAEEGNLIHAFNIIVQGTLNVLTADDFKNSSTFSRTYG